MQGEIYTKPRSNKKKIILVIILFLLIAGAVATGIFFFIFKQTSQLSINVVNTTTYPEFNIDNYEYIIYTTKDELRFECDVKIKLKGCNETVDLSSKQTTHVVGSGKREYTYQIYRVPVGTSTVSIKSINGVPKKWVRSAELVVNVENVGVVKKLNYTFDGGKTWQSSEKKEITQNGVYKIRARDYFGFMSNEKEVSINFVDSVAPVVSISYEKTGKNEAILNAVATDSISGIASYKWNNGNTTQSIVVTKEGEYTVSVKDVAGNITDKSIKVTFSSSEPTKDEPSKLPETNTNNNQQNNQNNQNNQQGNKPPQEETKPTPPKKIFTATFDGNGANLEANTRSCETTSESCSITTPAITRANYDIIGYSAKKDSTTAELSPNQTINISGNVTLYAITKRVVAADFILQDESAAEITSASNVSCALFNTQSSCITKSPALSAKSGYTVLGWNVVKDSEKASLSYDSTFSLSDNTTYYSITKDDRPISVYFTLQDPESGELEGGKNKCYLYNGASSCQLTTPTVITNDNYEFLGWTKNSEGSIIFPNQNTSFYVTRADSNSTFSAATKNNNTITAFFVVRDGNAIEIEKSAYPCEPHLSSCEITIPEVSVKAGYEFIGWTTNENSKEPNIDGATITITKDITIYSITKATAPLNATFVVQDSASGTIAGDNNKTCVLWNGATNCEIELPGFNQETEYDFIGWNTDRNGTSGEKDKKISINSNVEFYSITRFKELFSATFTIVNPDISSMSGGEDKCYKYNGAATCKIIAPTLTATSGYTGLGWDVNRDSKDPRYKSGETIEISGGEEFFSIVERVITANFHRGQNVQTETCVINDASTGCEFVFPDLIDEGGIEYLGWSRNSSSTSAEYSPGSTIRLTENTDFYAITKSSVVVNFIIQDQASTTSQSQTKTCTKYNGAQTCDITTPNPTPNSGYTIIGWNTDSSATVSSVSVNKTISLSTSMDYYLITRKTDPVVANFIITPSGPASGGEEIATASDDRKSCYLYNGATKCQIVSPTLNGKNGYTALGWSENPNSDSAEVGSNMSFMIGSSKSYYSIVKASFNISFNKNTDFGHDPFGTGTIFDNNIAATDLSFYSGVCISINGQYCKIQGAPRIYSSRNQVLGFSPTANGTPVLVYQSGFSQNATLYSRIWNFIENDNLFSLGTTNRITTNLPKTGDYYPTEYQTGIGQSVNQEYTNYMSQVFSNIPALSRSLYGKTRFSNMDTYNSYADYSGSAGVTYLDLGTYAFMDIMSPYNNVVVDDVKHVLVHELGHTIDGLFLDHTGKYLHEYSEFLNSYNELKSIRESMPDSTPASEKPLSDYAFTNEYEFLSEAFTAYYRDYYDGYARNSLGYTTPALNNAFSKYLCIASNNFNLESACE